MDVGMVYHLLDTAGVKKAGHWGDVLPAGHTAGVGKARQMGKGAHAARWNSFCTRALILHAYLHLYLCLYLN